MKQLTCIVVGGGYAGIHAVKSIRETVEGLSDFSLNVVLINKTSSHLRKVLLFKPAAEEIDIEIPLAAIFPEGVDLIQGTVTSISSKARQITYYKLGAEEFTINYDILVVAAGSVVRQPDPQQGGIVLKDVEAAAQIRKRWRTKLRQYAQDMASKVTGTGQPKRITIGIAGAGISGIETAAELAYAVRSEGERLGLSPDTVEVTLFNANERLFPEGPAKVGQKLEATLRACGITVLHEHKVSHEKEGVLTFSTGEQRSVDLCIWTLGLVPNPMLRSLGLPVTSDGHIMVDASYRVPSAEGIYSIGDCARIMDPTTGRPDGQTCKEAGAQAKRLGKVIAADLMGTPAPVHKGYMDFFCFGLGPEKGMAWTRQWGMDIFIIGKLGWRLRKKTWDTASLL